MKLVLMKRGLWGFTQESQETSPAADASVGNAFDIWQSLFAHCVEGRKGFANSHLFGARPARSLLHSRFFSPQEERCVTTLKTAVYQTNPFAPSNKSPKSSEWTESF